MSFMPLPSSEERKRDRRYKMAEILMQPQTNRIEHPFEGIANVLRAYSGHKMMNDLDKEYEMKDQQTQATMSGALSAYDKSQQGGQSTLNNGQTVTWNQKTPEQADNMLVSALSRNPNTAPMAMQMQMNDLQAKRDIQQKIKLAEALFPMELKKAQALAGVRSAASGLSVGGNTGALLDRLVEAGREDNEDYGLLDALEALKGGAGARGKLNAETELGRDAAYEKQSGKNESDLEYKPQIEGEITKTKNKENRINDLRNKMPKAQSTLVTMREKSQRITSDIDEVIADLESMAVPQGRVLSQYLPLTKANSINKKLESIKANFFVDELTEMRANSPTGGAVGNASDAEGNRLSNARAALDLNIQLPDLLENLKQAREATSGAVLRMEDAFSRDFSEIDSPTLQNNERPLTVNDLPQQPNKPASEMSDEELLKMLGVQ